MTDLNVALAGIVILGGPLLIVLLDWLLDHLPDTDITEYIDDDDDEDGEEFYT